MPTTPERAIYDRLGGAQTFHPASVNIFANDWALEPGDVVTVKSGEETYSVPVYSMDLQWNGAITTEIQSTGNQKREPLPALKRREYASNARGYGLQRELDNEVKRFTTHFEQTDYNISLIATETDLETLETLEQSMFQLQSGQITSIVSQSGTVTAVFSDSAHYNAGDRVLVKVNDVWVAYRFTAEHNPGPWTGQDATAISDLQSQITQNVSGITSLVSKTGVNSLGQGETLYSKITQEADRIDLVVTGYGNDKTVNTAGIILAINGGSGHSSASIEAENIILNGSNIIATGHFGAVSIVAPEVNCTSFYQSGQGGEFGVNADAYFYGDMTLDGDYLVAENMAASFGESVTTSSLVLTAGEGQGSTTISASDAPGMIKSVSVTNNTLTLTKFDGTIVNFSKATSMGGVWSGSTYTVTASQTNYNTTTEVDETTTVGTASVAIADWTWTQATSYRRVVTGTDDAGSTTYNVTLPTLTVVGRTPNSPAAVALVDVYGPEISGEAHAIAMGTIWLKQANGYAYIVNTNGNPVETGDSKNVMAKQALPTPSAVALTGTVTQSGSSWMQDATVTMSDSQTGSVTGVDVTGAYTTGFNAVGLTTNWTNGLSNYGSVSNTFNVLADNGQHVNQLVKLYVGSWASTNTCYAYIIDQEEYASTHRVARIQIDGSSRVYKGSNAVTLADPTWSQTNTYSGIATVKTVGRVNTSGASAELQKDIALSIQQGNWSNGSKTVQMKYNNDAVWGEVTVARPSVALSPVTLAATDTGTVSKTVTATYSDNAGTSSPSISIDASAVYNAVELTPKWTKTASPNPDPNNTYTVTADNGQVESTYLRLYYNGQFNSSHKTYVYLMNHGTFTADSYKKATLEVNATSVYTDGCDSVNPVSATISQSTQSGGGNS